MDYKVVGKGVRRADAVAKVTGKAKYTGDIPEKGMLYAKLFRATIGHGYVKSIDTSKAEAMDGVVKVVTYKDVPDIKYPTAGHPYCRDPKHQDCADRKMLSDKVRLYGDEIAAVIATSELTAAKALKLIEVEYEELPVLLDAEEAMKDGTPEIHEGVKNNILAKSGYDVGDIDIEEAFARADHIVEGVYETAPVQHCHMENHIAYAYMDSRDRIVVVTSTQIPHICTRILAPSMDLPMGRFRVIKPVIGGGFGAKQDVVLEPVVAFLTTQVDGRPVMLDLQREECMAWTRTRHGVKFHIKTGVSKEGRFLARQARIISTNGAYASHGHSIAAKESTEFFRFYPAELATKCDAYTVYTNMATAGAMRGYGVPQVAFAMESHADDIAKALNMNPVEIREKNMIKEGSTDPRTGVTFHTCKLTECIDIAKKHIDYDRKREEYAEQAGDVRRGVGLAIFGYGSGTWPVSLEIGGARITMNQDGSVQLFMGATEIGQGAETVFSQMAAETIGLPYEYVTIETTNDTDISPFDTGAYASRQSYVSGQAVKKAALEVREKVLERAGSRFDMKPEDLDIVDANIVRKKDGVALTDLADVALDSYYCTKTACTISSDVTSLVETNALSFGCTAAEVEVDLKTGKVDILNIISVHDSGKILNRTTAEGQVHGGMSMSVGMALAEVMLYDPRTGKPRNNNLLDYKMPTMMDTPHWDVEFVESHDQTGPYGNKSLGEPPAISPAPALRNAILNATGIAFNSTPMNPQNLFERFKEEGLV